MTFSIVACDRISGNVGVAITTSSIAVGSRCPWARAGIGAVATQNITDPSLGNAVLNYLEGGDCPQGAIRKVVQSESNIQYRQLTAVNTRGEVAHYTGKEILGTNAVSVGDGCVAAGNLLANESVTQAMVDAFVNRDTSLHLAENLVQCLRSGLDAGGEEGAVRSAAVLVASNHPWAEVDLRIDWTDDEPVARLAELWELYRPQCQDYLIRAISPKKAPSFGVPGDL